MVDARVKVRHCSFLSGGNIIFASNAASTQIIVAFPPHKEPQRTTDVDLVLVDVRLD